MQNLHRRFDWHYIGQIYGGDFAKFCGLLRIYELYKDVQVFNIDIVFSTCKPLFFSCFYQMTLVTSILTSFFFLFKAYLQCRLITIIKQTKQKITKQQISLSHYETPQLLTILLYKMTTALF